MYARQNPIPLGRTDCMVQISHWETHCSARQLVKSSIKDLFHGRRQTPGGQQSLSPAEGLKPHCHVGRLRKGWQVLFMFLAPIPSPPCWV